MQSLHYDHMQARECSRDAVFERGKHDTSRDWRSYPQFLWITLWATRFMTSFPRLSRRPVWFD